MTTIKWIKATTLGWLLGIIAILILSGIIEGLGANEFQFFMGLGMGAGLGIAQWFAARTLLKISRRWIWYTIVGTGAPFLLFDILKVAAAVQFGDYYILYSVVLAGATTGALQYLLLKPISSKAILWIPATFAGWLLAVVAFLGINYTNHFFHGNWLIFSANLFLILIGGVLLGTVTGICLKHLLRRN